MQKYSFKNIFKSSFNLPSLIQNPFPNGVFIQNHSNFSEEISWNARAKIYNIIITLLSDLSRFFALFLFYGIRDQSQLLRTINLLSQVVIALDSVQYCS